MSGEGLRERILKIQRLRMTPEGCDCCHRWCQAGPDDDGEFVSWETLLKILNNEESGDG